MIKIIWKNQSVEVDLKNGNSLALYDVPESYSEDKLFLALWGQNELEPLPACSIHTLLLRMSKNNEGGLIENCKAEGVSYAEN